MNLICKLFGHDWIFPSRRIFGSYKERIKSISESDYRCRRCGTIRDE